MSEYKPQKLEKKIQEFWDENDIFQKVMDKTSDSDRKFSFFDGPITANNPMGVHHTWGRAYKDLFLRYKGMQGFKTRRQNGFDCQGLWVEVEVEKDLGFRSKRNIEKYGIKNFVEKCKERVRKYSNQQTEDSIRLGMWMDWDDSYYTMSDRNNEHNWFFLKQCWEKGWIYQGRDVVPWCPRCSTAISHHEIATGGYKKIMDKGITMEFPLKGKEDEYVLVWTTTPWTVLANVALAVDPELNYVKVKQGDKIYYLSKKCLDELKGDSKVLEELKGEELVGLGYLMPYEDLPAQSEVEHKIIPWSEVGAEEGTGVVHIAPGCGPEDYELGKELDLKAISPLDEFGKYKEGYDWLSGIYAGDANPNIIEELQDKGFIYKVEDYEHSYPHCWRCHTPLVFRLVDEWFIQVDEIRSKLIQKAKEVNWNPSHGEKRMLDWLEHMDDWLISKDRYWGLPLPFWVCENGHLQVIGTLDELEEKAIKGVDQLKELHRPWIDEVVLECPECGEEMERVEDVGTPWLDAGIMSFSTLDYLHDKKHWKEWFPADFITECGPGQYKNWFYSMLIMAVVLEGEAPYKNVLAHELVLDENGEEMHKSKGNAIWAHEALESMGADVMRWIYSKQNPNVPLKFGYTVGDKNWRKLNILYNFVKYLETYAIANNFKPGKLEPKKDPSRWILSRLESLKKFVTQELDKFQPDTAAQELEKFFLEDLSRFYGQLIRRQIKPYKESEGKKEVLETFYYVTFETLKVLAPFIPFLTESLYQDFFRKFEGGKSIHLFGWPQTNEDLIDKDLEERMAIVQRVVEAGNSARENLGIGLRYPVKKIVVGGKDKVKEAVKDSKEILEKMLNSKEIEVGEVESKPMIKLDYSKAGPKYGDAVKEIEQLLEKGDDEEFYRELEERKEIEVGDYRLKKEDLEVREKTPENLSGESFEGGVLYLEKGKSEDLEKERKMRDFIRNIQILRKEEGLNVGQWIKLSVDCDEKARKIIDRWRDELERDAGVSELSFTKVEGREVEYKDFKAEISVEVLR